MTSPIKLTTESIEAKIKKIDYIRVPDTTLTICLITLLNGVISVGQSMSLTEEAFDAETGRKVAHRDAFDKLYEIEGCLLKEKLYQDTLSVV
jgi:hypothetical protein